MDKICIQAQRNDYLTTKQVHEAFERYVNMLPAGLKNILILPPDATRKHSGTGELTRILYSKLKDRAAVTIMPATGTHQAMTKQELADMFSDIPLSRFIAHRWREDTELLGVVPAEVVRRISSGSLSDAVRVTVNRRLLSGEFDLIISVGQVLPHEVVGMANYSKNVLVGAGGEEIINKSHFIGATYGLERLIGRDHSPVRKLYDYAEKAFLSLLPIQYVLTVNSTAINPHTGFADAAGLFIGRGRSLFEAAVALSQQRNITYLPRPVKKFVVFLDEKEFRSSWVGCKAIYRTRLAVADGGEILVVAPGLERFGEDALFDGLIRKYGYVGTARILRHVDANADLRANLAAAAHLIHGSTEGRFRVTFACDAIAGKELEEVNFGHMSLKEARERYGCQDFSDGLKTTPSGEEVYCISNPAAGLWVAGEKFKV